MKKYTIQELMKECDELHKSFPEAAITIKHFIKSLERKKVT